MSRQTERNVKRSILRAPKLDEKINIIPQGTSIVAKLHCDEFYLISGSVTPSGPRLKGLPRYDGSDQNTSGQSATTSGGTLLPCLLTERDCKERKLEELVRMKHGQELGG